MKKIIATLMLGLSLITQSSKISDNESVYAPKVKVFNFRSYDTNEISNTLTQFCSNKIVYSIVASSTANNFIMVLVTYR